MKTTYLFLSLITAALILPTSAFAQASSDESGEESNEDLERLINQLYEEREAAEELEREGDSSNAESSQEDCENEPEEKADCADDTWDSFEENALNTLSNSQPKKTGKHKRRAAQGKFKESKQQKHANAEEKAYGPSEEDDKQRKKVHEEKKKKFKPEKPVKAIFFFPNAGSHG